MLDAQLNKSQKFVRILEIMQRRGGVKAHELMARFDLDPRALRRYLADLRDIGVPIVDNGTAEDRVVSLDPNYSRAGVQLTLGEVLSLHFGRTLFTFLEGTSFADDLNGALERLETAMSRYAADLTSDLDRKFLAVGEHAKRYDAEVLDEVISALLYSNPADAEYVPVRGIGKIYRLEPLTLATYRQGLYLLARDAAEDKIKSFAVERFLRFSRLRRENFRYPADYDPRALVANSFGIVSGEPVDVRAVFTPEVALYVRERQWHASQRVDVLPDGGVRLTMRVANSPELREWLLGFGANVRVESPPELVEHVKAQHRAALARYE